MLKVFNPGPWVTDDLQGCYFKNFLPFDIEEDQWQYTTDVHQADIIAIHGHNMFGDDQIYKKVEQIKRLNLRPEQKILFLHIYHIDHCFPDKMYFLFARKVLTQEIPNQFAIVHTNFALDLEIQYDFLWNRQKIYFTDYNRIDLHDRLYVNNTDIKNFELRPIVKMNDNITNTRRKFLCPNRVYQNFDHERFKYRRQLLHFIREFPYEYGHYSDFKNNLTLQSENPMPENFMQDGGWYPIANHYYWGTYFSIYVETLTGNINQDYPYKSITEKTWDPLIKGHFILPFGYKGLIDHIRSYGFKLPDWIDYSYDVIDDNQLRFEAFLESARKLMNYSMGDWENLYFKDRDMLVHNRKLFWKRPYDSLYDKVVRFFEIGK